MIADGERSEPTLGRLVEDGKPPPPQVGRVAAFDVPREPPWR